MTDELIDILNEEGNFTGETALKSEAHRLGLYHASVHIWFYTKSGDLLFQKRADNKDTFPGLWDVSVAGHIGSGEKPIEAAIREIKEEIGILVPQEDLYSIGTYLAKKNPTPFIFDNEFHYIYLSILNTPISSLKLQKEEVSDVKLITLNMLEDLLIEPLKDHRYVPHDIEYFNLIFTEIRNRIQ